MTAPVPLRIRGVDYPSINQAAKALGVCINVVWRALDEGRLETVGLYRTHGRPKSVTINGVVYPSQLAAVAATGLSKAVVWRLSMIERGIYDAYVARERNRQRATRLRRRK